MGAGSGGGQLAADFSALDTHAAEVKQIAERIDGEIQALAHKVQSLAGTWRGHGAMSAEAVAAKLQQAGRLVAEAVGDHGTNVSKASAAYQQGEQYVSGLFPNG